MATLKLYNPILSEATKECYWFCDEAGTSFKDVDEFINGIPAGDDNIELLLHCDGGEVREGWAIVDKLRSTGKKITATIEGNCASMATVVGTTSRRCSISTSSEPERIARNSKRS